MGGSCFGSGRVGEGGEEAASPVSLSRRSSEGAAGGRCEGGHLLCGACLDGSHCRKGDCATAFAHCGPELDMFVGNARDACAYAPCHCAVPGCPFTATPPRLRDHLAVDHAWPLDTLPLHVPVSAPASSEPQQQHHRLVVVEGDERSLFALSMCPCGVGAASCAIVSVSCVRRAPPPRPARYSRTCSGRGRRRASLLACPPGIAGRRLMMETDVASCAVPVEAAVEDGMALYVPPSMLSG
ncbi:uncharacterized protein [Miscanthus floridulus]|uniref:uncharacterized protein n=1 Tax=Miscanthus floridulus TaxID=154761 RepID=UPI003458CAC7